MVRMMGKKRKKRTRHRQPDSRIGGSSGWASGGAACLLLQSDTTATLMSFESETPVEPNKVGPVTRAFRFIRYYKWNILVPGVCGFLIWADYSHTAEWKRQKALNSSVEPQ